MLKHALDSGRERTVMFDSFSEDIGEKKCEENKIIFEWNNRKFTNSTKPNFATEFCIVIASDLQ